MFHHAGHTQSFLGNHAVSNYGSTALTACEVIKQTAKLLTNEFSEFFAIVVLTSRIIAAKDEHRKDAPLEPTARLSGDAILAGISETDESFVASAILKHFFQKADAT